MRLANLKKARALVDPPMSVCDLRIFSLTPQRAECTSSALRRPWDEHVREGRAISIILGVHAPGLGPCARLTREGVRLTVHRPAHPVDGSGPRSRARRIFPNDRVRASERAQVYPPKCLRMCTPASRCLGAQHCLLHASGRHLRAIWSHRDILGGPGATQSAVTDGPCVRACVLCTGCGARVHGLRSDRCLCRCSPRRVTGDARAEIGSTLDPDNYYRCFGDGELHRTNVVRSSGRVAFVPRRETGV